MMQSLLSIFTPRGRRFGISLVFLGVSSLLVPACQSCKNGGAKSHEVVVYTSVDQVFSEPIFRYCEKKTGLSVKAVFDTEETKSTGVLNRLIAEARHPQADVFWSGDPVRPFILRDKKMLRVYRSAAAADLPKAFKAADGMWTGVAARARLLLVNTRLVPKDARPRNLVDLTDPKWRGRVAIANPLFGTTTMHIAALFTAWGDVKAKQFLMDLKTNKVRIATSNGEVRRLVVGGEVAIGLTDTDDAYHAKKSGAPVAIVYPDQEGLGTLIMPTTVVLLAHSPNSHGGERLLDCLLGPDVESRMAMNADHMPLRPGVKAPTLMKGADKIKAMKVDYAKVAETMVRIQPWLRRWAGY